MADLADALSTLHPQEGAPDFFIHPKAQVDDNCEIGEGSRVFQFASVLRGARVGKNSIIGPCAVLDGSVVGDNTAISPHLMAGPGFWIGDDVFIGPNITFCNDMWPRRHRIGFDESKLRDPEKWTIVVENGASVGANCVLLPGITIGEGAMVAAGAVVVNDVPPDTLLHRKGWMSKLDGVTEMNRCAQRMKWAVE